MMRADLDTWSTFWFWSLVCSTIAVAIGIICEAPEVWQTVGVGRKTAARIREFWYIRVRKIYLNDWEQLCPELVSANDRHRKWIARSGLLGWMLVAFGVAGEGVAEYFVNDAETNLRAFDQAVLVETQHSADSAEAAALIADAFSDKAIASSSSATSLAKKARKEADSVERDIVAAKEQATKAENDLAAALQRTIRLEQQLSWRTVTPEQKAKLKALLLSSNLFMPLNNLKIGIMYLNQNPEAEEYARELKDALDGFGAEIPEPQGIELLSSKALQGVILTGNPIRNPKATFLLNALNHAAIAVSGERSDKMDEHGVNITVGSRPRN